MNNRFLIDENRIIAGLGHVMAGFNPALKLALRHNLEMILPNYPSKIGRIFIKLRSHLRFMLYREERMKARVPHEGDLFTMYKRFLNFRNIGITQREFGRVSKRCPFKTVKLPELYTNTKSKTDELDYREVSKIIESENAGMTLFVMPYQGPKRTDGNYTETLDWIRNRFDEVHHKPFLREDELNAVINIRRGDIVGNERFTDRLMPDKYYSDLIDLISNSGHSKKVNFKIYSDCEKYGCYVDENGIPRNWAERKLYNKNATITFIEKADWMETLKAMRYADILVTSKSGFSHLGGILNTRLVLACPMWHIYPNKNVYILNDGANLDNEIIENIRKL